ncbi:Fe-S cluster assembly protein IscX [Neptuniibacter marinus]|uniref:Fe-S cluster assembly protein IscX n=1 Tax=Neptuniibacter marinus TaxID=1806670 RepID=UPI0008343E33|nr:Fe-S cluster assembly protein IscX [Neptuniibacter marinus]
MSLKWVDVLDIAIELSEKYPEQDPMAIGFPDLYQKVMDLEEFDDDPDRCGEKILEGIQMAWIEEMD